MQCDIEERVLQDCYISVNENKIQSLGNQWQMCDGMMSKLVSRTSNESFPDPIS